MNSRTSPAIIAVFSACLLAGCGAGAPNPAESGSAPAATAATGAPHHKKRRAHRRRTARVASVSSTSLLLKGIRVAPESSSAGYHREAFPLWIEQGGCDTREDVLIKERKHGAPHSCSVRKGKWLSAYDGETITRPSNLDIDHVVPLEQAYVSGARRWSFGTRRRFANDLGYTGSLRAVSAESNRSKGDSDPAGWMPPRAAFRCKYVGTWIAVKYRWRLKADSAEYVVLKRWVRSCGSHADVRKPRRARIRYASPPPAHRDRRHHSGSGGKHTDPRFKSCADAIGHGYGPYRRGIDREYRWYRDADNDGVDCES